MLYRTVNFIEIGQFLIIFCYFRKRKRDFSLFLGSSKNYENYELFFENCYKIVKNHPILIKFKNQNSQDFAISKTSWFLNFFGVRLAEETSVSSLKHTYIHIRPTMWSAWRTLLIGDPFWQLSPSSCRFLTTLLEAFLISIA